MKRRANTVLFKKESILWNMRIIEEDGPSKLKEELSKIQKCVSLARGFNCLY
jgi:hypothetical protein